MRSSLGAFEAAAEKYEIFCPFSGNAFSTTIIEKQLEIFRISASYDHIFSFPTHSRNVAHHLPPWYSELGIELRGNGDIKNDIGALGISALEKVRLFAH